MKIRNTIYLFVTIALAACTADDLDLKLSPEQQTLIGQRVNFSASMADQFVTRTTYHSDGSFNDGDQMRIFCQYAKSGDVTETEFEEGGEIFRTYYYKMNFAAETSVSLDNDWLPAPEKYGKKKKNDDGTVDNQTSEDSLTWENGRTVRFRAWGRSNLSGALYATGETDAEKKAKARSSYYPDYTVSDWVTVSGPTQNIPLTMRHIACRIALTCKGGNEFGKVELCLKDEDYSSPSAAEEVRTAYNKMCMPAGVDDKTFQLTAMTSALYNDENTNLNNIEQYSAGIVKIGEKTAAEIASDVQHPLFKNNNGNQYLMAIPFDMSSDNPGKELKLPACTRFKVWLYDVNHGSEPDYHIFELSDIKNGTEPAFPDGLTLKAGYSYTFSVGYQYNQFTITTTNDFSWDNVTVEPGTIEDKTPKMGEFDFSWWKKAYVDAATIAIAGSDFIPSFSIENEKQFITFINLVNGTAAQKMSGLTRGEVLKDENGETKKVDGFDTYWWTVDGEYENGKPKQITRADAEKLGYVFYPHFYPSGSTQKAYVIEDYIKGPIDFVDDEFGTRYVVELAKDLDFNDLELPSIGDYANNKPFGGNFKGKRHLLSNLNINGGYLFDYVKDGAITNLRIESVHNTSLLNIGEKSGNSGWGCYIAGISMICPSAGNSIAKKLTGSSYVVGCIHVGNAGGALVGEADVLTMMGCMQAAAGLDNTTGALLGNSSVTWGTFMYNYYDVELSAKATAVAGEKDKYDYDTYIRGCKSHVLKAVEDYMINPEVDKKKLSSSQLSEMYGLAPWNAMNQGIDMYNATSVGKAYPCSMRYSTTENYTNRYPILK